MNAPRPSEYRKMPGFVWSFAPLTNALGKPTELGACPPSLQPMGFKRGSATSSGDGGRGTCAASSSGNSRPPRTRITHCRSPNLLNQTFAAKRPDEARGTDITYIPTRGSSVSLACQHPCPEAATATTLRRWRVSGERSTMNSSITATPRPGARPYGRSPSTAKSSTSAIDVILASASAHPPDLPKRFWARALAA